MGRAGLIFAYVCFLLSLGLIAGAIYILPAAPKVKGFLGVAALLLTSMFAFTAFAAHAVTRPQPEKPKKPPPRG